MLEKLKLALQIVSDAFDSELNALISSALIDLNIGGVESEEIDEIMERAIICYCSYHFELSHGSLNRADAMKKAYDEQKAMLGMATGYTVWS